jgi:hypothetical protein
MLIGLLVLVVIAVCLAVDRDLPVSGPGDGPVKVGAALLAIGTVGTFLLWWTIVPMVLAVAGLAVMAVARRRLAAGSQDA